LKILSLYSYENSEEDRDVLSEQLIIHISINSIPSLSELIKISNRKQIFKQSHELGTPLVMLERKYLY
jgi:hypothetical protein